MRYWEWCGLMGQAIDPIQHQSAVPLAAIPGCRVLCILWIPCLVYLLMCPSPFPPSEFLLSHSLVASCASSLFVNLVQHDDPKGIKSTNACVPTINAHALIWWGAHVQTVQEHAWLFLKHPQYHQVIGCELCCRGSCEIESLVSVPVFLCSSEYTRSFV